MTCVVSCINHFAGWSLFAFYASAVVVGTVLGALVGRWLGR